MSGLYNSTAWGQQTLASQTLAAKASGARGGRRSAAKRRKSRSAAAPRKRRKSAKRMKSRLVKGSPAAKRYMASIRRKRKR